jgi:hypothetical protein
MTRNSQGNIEDQIDSFYSTVENLSQAQGMEKGRYYVLSSSSNRDKAYLELGVRPVTFRPLHRYEDFEEIISKYYEAGLEKTARTDRNPHFISKVSNNLFRSRIKIRTSAKELDFWMAKLGWIFGNRIKAKYRSRD